MQHTGAIAAYKGYRTQALYALYRVLTSQQKGLFFQPEKYEDLTVYEDSGKILEAVQVKALTTNLSLSDFSPEKTDSFFRRSLTLINGNPSIKIIIISFGPIGPEMNKAWSGEPSFQKDVTTKLSKNGFSSDDIKLLFRNIEIMKANEEELKDQVLSFLTKSLAGGDPGNAFDLLHYWLYKASEKRELITYSELISKINNVGRYLTERTTHHQEWFTSIVPLEDNAIGEDERKILSTEFYQGISTQYKHILANFDITRDDKLQLVNSSLQKSNIVILHGASGQGKSTLAYRYLKDFVPEGWRYEIRLLEDRQHALRVARALSGHANAIDAPMFIYVDVSPRDKGWSDLLKELASYKNFHVLVTIREEDLRKENIARNDFDFEPIELTFDEKEASQIYEKLAAIQQPGQFLSFKEAWSRFGSKGPLMEFVYLVTHNESLHERLRCQIDRLRDMAREGKIGKKELCLLRMVAVASAYDARLDVKPLCELLDLIEPARTIELFEKEYLLRQREAGKHVEGLHPIRSSILVELLTAAEFTPWVKVAIDCLPVIVEDDLETFLLYSFSRRAEDAEKIFDSLLTLQPKTWTGAVGIFRALLWLGLSRYVVGNRELIQDLFGQFGSAWHFFLDFDIADVSGDTAKNLFKNLDFIPEENKKLIEDSQKKQIPKTNVFVYGLNWVAKMAGSIKPPAVLSDWSGLSELCFWVGHLNIQSSILSSVDEQLVDGAIEILPLDHLADLHFALSILWVGKFEPWIERKKEAAFSRFREETNTIFIEDDTETIKIHYVIGIGGNDQEENEQEDTPTNTLHDETIKRIELLRRLYPVRKKYGGQGYGHNTELFRLPDDGTLKTGIPASQFLPPWGTKLNSRFSNLSNYECRPETWREYADSIYQTRNSILISLKELQNGLIAHHRKQKPVDIFKDYIDSDGWQTCRSMANHTMAFPKSVIDEWGNADENNIKKDSISLVHPPTTVEGGAKQNSDSEKISLNLWRYRKYLSSLKGYTGSLSNFFQQSQDVIVLNAMIGKAKSAQEIDHIRQLAGKKGIKTDGARLATYNFAEALKELPLLQKEFRNLFSSFFDGNVLNSFERRESEAIAKAWSLWYQFALHPTHHFQDAESESFSRLKTAFKQVHKDINKCLSKLNDTNTTISTLSANALCEGHPALWITFDICNPVSLYESLESIKNALKAILSSVEFNSLKYYALQLLFPSIVAIPLIRGKSINRTAWKFSSMMLAMGPYNGEQWWHYIPYQIPSDSWDMLGLSSWEHPRLDIINRFQSSIAFFSVLIAHVNVFNSLPNLDDKGTNLLQAYVLSLNKKISDALQGYLDSASEMLDYFNSREEVEKGKRPFLLQAVTTLRDLHYEIINGKELNGKLQIGLSELKEWVPHLQSVLGQTELVRLLWVADVLDASHQLYDTREN